MKHVYYLLARISRPLFVLLLLSACSYGTSRLYFAITDGFTLGNIQHPLFVADPKWEVRSLSDEEVVLIEGILSQPFFYLGKGCQSYVFESEDGRYVLKLLKYHRFRLKPWVQWFSFLPSVQAHKVARQLHKDEKIETLYTCWKTAFDHLSEETGVVYVHLNPSEHLPNEFMLKDKIGISHKIDLNTHQFLIQKKAEMLSVTLDEWMEKGESVAAKNLLDELVALFLSENARGFADLDHALLQNTGVLDGKPIHLDVGQLQPHPVTQDPQKLHQELFNKTYKFRVWLRKEHPSLAIHLESRLKEILGESLYTLVPTHLQESLPPLEPIS